jgi:hypothetical protein
VAASHPSTLVYLCALHPWHDQARFSGDVVPPRLRGPTCSAENDCGENASWLRQYSQQPAARARTCVRIASVTRPLATARNPEAEVFHQRLDRGPPKSGQLDQGLRPADREPLGFVNQAEQLGVLLRR